MALTNTNKVFNFERMYKNVFVNLQSILNIMSKLPFFKVILMLILTNATFLLNAQTQLQSFQNQFPDQSIVILEKLDSLVIQPLVEVQQFHKVKKQVLRTIRPEVLNTSISYDDFSPIQNIKAEVARVQIDGTVETSDKVNKSYQNTMVGGIFYHDNKMVDISYPFNTIGTISTLEYAQNITQPHFINKFIFSEAYPVLSSRYVVYCHKSVEIGYTLMNAPADHFQFTKKEVGDYWLYEWEMKDANAWKASSFREILETEPHLLIRIKSAQVNGVEKLYLKDMNAFYSWLYEFVEPQMSPSEEMKLLSAELTKGIVNPIEKLQAIYNWVQANITYVAFEDGFNGFIPRKPEDVCRKKYGDCKDMALLLFTLLKSAGLEANIVWIGSDDIPYKIEEVLSPGVFNHMIACAEIDGKRYWLDATAKYLDFNYTSPFTQGKEGLIAKSKTEYEILTLPITPSENNKVVDSIELNINGNQIYGSRKFLCSGYEKLDFLYDMLQLDEKKIEDVSDYFSMGNDSYRQTRFEIKKNENKHAIAAEMFAEFTIDNHVKTFGNKVLLNPIMVKFGQGNMFDKKLFSTKNYEFKSQRIEITQLNLGDLTVQNIPKDILLDSDLLHYSATYFLEQNQLTIQRKFEIKKYYLTLQDAEEWNNLIKQINALESDQLVLVKA
jgi:transglutaminase-like putative cysteine protease